jgi:hypothetical protein
VAQSDRDPAAYGADPAMTDAELEEMTPKAEVRFGGSATHLLDDVTKTATPPLSHTNTPPSSNKATLATATATATTTTTIANSPLVTRKTE